MIDEKALIEHLRVVGVGEGIERAIDIVSRQPKISDWIPVGERLPLERINPITKDFYIYPVTFKLDGVTDVRYLKFGKGHWWNGCEKFDDYVIAWMPLVPYEGVE